MRFAALAFGVAVLVTSCAGPAPAVPGNVAPILFVHGYGESAAVFDDLREHLRDRGYPDSFLAAVELVPDGSNVAAAEQVIAPAVQQLVDAVGGGPSTKVDIVAHSMGALSSRWYAATLRPQRVRTLVTVVGANHGTDVICDGSPAAADMCPAFATDDAHVVQLGLNGRPGQPVDETPFGRAADGPGVPTVAPDRERVIRYVAVSLPEDEWIKPVASCRLDGADPVGGLPDGVAVTEPTPGNLLFGEATDHDRILTDDRFFRVLDAVLTGSGGPE